MRWLLGLLLLALCAAGGFLVYRHLTAGLPINLPRPAHLEVTYGGKALPPGGWVNSPDITLRAAARPGVAAAVDFEIRHVGRRFTGVPTQSTLPPGGEAQRPGDPPVTVHLADGAYHWRARLHNAHGLSRWETFAGTIRVDTQAPSTPRITSSTDPSPGTTYHSATFSASWSAADVGSGIVGYSYRLDGDPRGGARPQLRTPSPSVTLSGLPTGSWYFHVRALDRAGNWGPSSTFPVKIDVTPPGLTAVSFSRFQFDPQFHPLTVSFGLTRPASLVRLGVYRQDTHALVRLYTLRDLPRGRQVSLTWDGTGTDHRYVRPGDYEVFVRATDQWGHSSLQGWHDFVVDYRRIVVSLSQQRLWAYDGSRLILTSLVTTGNRALPTPTGTYDVMGKFHPYTFISPWPKSSPYYYKPSKVQYALLFRAGGYFIHDAPWRSAFGPGTNAQLGTPGTNYTGTHGCVNVPPDVAQRLYAWADVGTIVQVER